LSAELPSWEKDFIRRSRQHTRRIHFIRLLDTLTLLSLPTFLSVLPTINEKLEQRPYLAIMSVFGGLALLSVFRQVMWHLIVPKYTHFWGRVVRRIGMICLWGAFCLWWYILSDTNIFFVILGWWLCGVPFMGFLWLERKWDLRGAKLIKQNYKLFGIKRLSVGSHRKKLGSLQLYELPEGSPRGDYSAQTIVARKPTAYIGSSMMDYLTPNQLSAVIAHELGHSLSTDSVVFQIGRWGWRIFGLPLILWFMHMVPSTTTPRLNDGSVFHFLTASVVAWLGATWIARILDRQIELQADLFALKLATGAQDLVDGMGKMALQTLYNVFPNFIDWLGMVSHPALMTRMRKVQAVQLLPEKKPG
jgi:hypothetical protein